MPSIQRSAIENCIRCDYSLAGHSGTFRCPECGLAYDPNMSIWYPKAIMFGYRTDRTPSLDWLLIALVFTIMGILNLRLHLVVGMFVILVLVVTGIWQYVRLRRMPVWKRQPVQVICREGILTVSPSDLVPNKTLPWDDLVRRREDGSLELGVSRGILACRAGLNLPYKEVVKFDEAVRRYVANLRLPSDASGRPGTEEHADADRRDDDNGSVSHPVGRARSEGEGA